MFELNHSDIKKAIIKSQHCQRNWDLSKEIPSEDLDLLLTAATQCPSKQNVAFYKLHFVTNRDLIEQIHDQTRGFTTRYEPYEAETNSQTLANLLIVFEKYDYTKDLSEDIHRSDETRAILNKSLTPEQEELLKRDREMAVGIAAGYLNLTATILGYSTGCCACFSPQEVKRILNLEDDPILLMGIGFKNPEMNRRIHHTNHNFTFPTKVKQEIKYQFYS